MSKVFHKSRANRSTTIANLILVVIEWIHFAVLVSKDTYARY